MVTIRVSLDTELLLAADRAARLTRKSRSALIRDALREHLHEMEIRALEERDREGYRKQPQARDEALAWEAAASLPAE
jgi:metal-responsive CopG/Arc/MetJ family transcriptional regulator